MKYNACPTCNPKPKKIKPVREKIDYEKKLEIKYR